MSVDIKKVSPYDAQGHPVVNSLVQIRPADKKRKWVPSQFNSRTTAEDGNLILWNSRTGAISVFKPDQKRAVETLLSRSGVSGELNQLGRYLKDKGYLVAFDADEVRQFRTAFGQQHFRQDTLELILLASEDCNLRCEYCYEDFKRGTMLPEVRESIKKLVARRVADGVRNLGVSWFGGEPLYGFAAIEDLGPYFVDMVERYSINYSVSMTTNGYLLTPDIADKLLAWRISNFQITVDGVAEDHDRNRHARDGSGTFETIFNNLRLLKQRPDKFFVRIRINFDAKSHPHLEDFLALVQHEFGGDPRYGVAFYGVGQWGGGNDANLDVCGQSEVYQIQSRLEKSALEKGLQFGTLAEKSGTGGQVCYAARPYNYVIGADGKVMKCTVALDKREDNIVGVLERDGELRLDDERYSLWVEPVFETDQGCQKCYLLPHCQGLSCPLIRFNRNESPCDATAKPDLHNRLVATYEVKKANARQVSVAR